MTAPVDRAATATRIASSLDETLVVEAAAGTGKTTALVRRMVRGAGHGPRRDGRPGRGDVHREGRRRAEAAAAAGAREDARATRRAAGGRARRRSKTR